MPTTYWEEEYILPEERDIPVTMDNVQIGMRVRRGKDWAKQSKHAWWIPEIYTDKTTGGPDCVGIIKSFRNIRGDAGYGWAQVDWQHGQRDWWYRIGANDMYDLYIAKDE
jgi:hypothetical protein